MQKRWPERLWIVRHGQSAGNVARDAADAAGLPQIDIAVRDADVPLSRLGEEQSVALGRWFSAMAVDERLYRGDLDEKRATIRMRSRCRGDGQDARVD